MNTCPPLQPPIGQDSDPEAEHAAWAQAMARRQIERLDELSEIGLALARDVQAAEAPPTDTAMAFSRIARAVRMTALLQTRLLGDLEKMRRQDAAARQTLLDEAADEARRLEPAYRHKARVEAVVERIPKSEHDDEDEIDRIVIEAGERLDSEDLYGDVLQHPIGELVALLCRDLDLHPDWERLAEEAWAKEEAEIGSPASPFMRPPPLAGEVAQRAGGGPQAPTFPKGSAWTPPQSLRDSSPASGGARETALSG